MEKEKKKDEVMGDNSEQTPIKSLVEVEKEHIEYVLQTMRGNQTKAAKYLGLKRTTLQSRMKKLGINIHKNK